MESEFFPDIETQSRLIQTSTNNLRQLRRAKENYLPEEYEEEKETLKKELDNLKKRKEEMLTCELEAASASVRAKDFSFGIEEVDVGTPIKAFVAERNAATFFALKQVQYNIRRLYKVKQANRHQIVCQLRELLGDSFPKYIIRTDISSFYESIPRRQLLRKLNNDPLLTLTSKRIIRRILFEYGKVTGNDTGLPRGIGISAYLAELYMRDVDNLLKNHLGVLYYARYVDDIFIIFSPPPNVGTSGLRRAVASTLQQYGLKRNRSKTAIITLDTSVSCSIEYLGYKFEMQSGAVSLNMTDRKIHRYKQRIDLSFDAYNKQSVKSERKARALLEKRIRFMTGNTRLVNNKKNIVSGIYFSNSLLSSHRDLSHLDRHLQRAVAGISSIRLRRRLSNYLFVYGFETKKYYQFSTRELSQIVEVWKHVP